jgi:hypothetical protein
MVRPVVLATLLFIRALAAPLFSLPASVNLSSATVVDPSAAGAPDELVLAIFRVGAGPTFPLSWDLSARTGAALPAADSRGTRPLVVGSTALQFGNSTFGALLNLTADPLEPGASLGTVTIGYDWDASRAAAPWAGSGGGLELSIQYQVPTARKTGVAVYTSWTVGLATASADSFVWYETALFDLDRPLGGDVVWLDTISGRPIVHGVLSQTQTSNFHRVFPDSANSATSTWAGFRRFHFAIEAAHVAAAMAAANAKFNLTLSTDPADWRLVHTNVEVEGTAGGTAAHSLREMIIDAL